MSWFEFKHLLRDIRHRSGWYPDYPYAKVGERLHRTEVWLRRLTCRIRGHRFHGGEHGEWRAMTWKSWCAICWAIPPWAEERGTDAE